MYLAKINWGRGIYFCRYYFIYSVCIFMLIFDIYIVH